MAIAALIIASIACMVSVFTLGLVLAPHFVQRPARPSERPKTASTAKEPAESEESIKELREKIQKENEAFLELMNYNADVAYGRKEVVDDE